MNLLTTINIKTLLQLTNVCSSTQSFILYYHWKNHMQEII